MRRRLLFIILGALATAAVVVVIFVSTIRASDNAPVPSVSPSAPQSASPLR